MTSQDREARTDGKRRLSKKRRRARRAKRARRLAAVVTVVALTLGLVGLGLWLLLSGQPQLVAEVYPIEYEAQIRARAAENELDPALVAAVILAESSYRPDAVSEANAQGLMQLLPDTAEWIAGKFDESYVEGCLFDPDTNIKYGCWYLGYLIRRFDGYLTCAVAAYHAGQGTVDGWLANPEYSEDGETLSQIPSQATETYVKRVLRYYEKYQELYVPQAA